MESNPSIPEGWLYIGDIMEATGDITWYTCGNMTKQGNPRHPLYVKKDEKFDWFPVFDYSLAWMY